MKAVFINRHGGPDVLELGELPKPVPEAGEVLIRVRACGLNHLDIWIRRGLPNLKLTYPHVPGSDFAGHVEEIRPTAPNSFDPPLAVGDRVVAFPSISCGRCEACYSGRDDMCRRLKLMGEHIGGGCAQYVRVPLRNVFRLPDHVEFTQAAALPVAYVTAWHMLTTRGGLRRGEWVLVTAAGSGVSTGAIQMAKVLGAKVIAAASSGAKLAKARELGADFAVNYSEKDWSREVKKIAGEQGIGMIVDHVGESKWEDYIRILARGGRIVLCGASSGYDSRTDLRHVFFRRLSIIGSTMGTLAEFKQVLDMASDGSIRPVIHKVLPLSEAREAQRILEDREVIGKVVLEIP